MATQLEDVPIKDFLKQLKKLGEYTITAQADGLTLFIGIDSDGNFYTSPFSPEKRTKFSYKVSDYPQDAQSNSFKSAHAALLKVANTVKEFVESGQAIEAQIVSLPPEAMDSAKNVIYLVRGVVGEIGAPDKKAALNLAEKLSSKDIQARVKLLVTQDGEALEVREELVKWQIKHAKAETGHMLSTPKLNSIIKKLQSFLAQPSEAAGRVGLEITNMDVAAADLTKIPMPKREAIKAAREKINKQITVKYKLPIKSELLAQIEDNFSTGAGLLHKGSDAVWIASDDFTATSKFDTIAKREISGFQRSNDKHASLEDRGGIMGIAQQRIADFIGVPELSLYQSATKVFKLLRGANPRATAAAFAKQLDQLNFNGVRTKIQAILTYSKEQILIKRDEFKQSATSFELTTGDGDKVAQTPESIKQNLLVFAQTLSDLDDQISEVGRSRDFTDLVLALYGPIIYKLHGRKLQESFLGESIGNPPLQTLKSLTAEDICHAYTATLLAAQLLIRAKDRQAASMLRDTAHASMKTHSQSMSPLNFWGHVVFNSFLADMKGLLSPKVAPTLKKLAGRLTAPRVKKLHQSLSTSSNLIQDWEFQEETAKLIAVRLDTRGQAINMAIVGIRHWDDISLSDKNTIIAKVFYYLQQHSPSSPLLSRIRILANATLMAASKENNLDKHSVADMNENLLLNLSNLAESEMGLTTMGNALSSSDVATFADFGTQMDASSANSTSVNKGNSANKNKPTIPTQALKFMNGKPIVRKKRDFNRKNKFARYPEESRQEVKEDEGDVAPVAATTTSSSDIATYPQRLFTGKNGKKKRTIKRIIPSVPVAKNMFAKMTEELHSITLEWTDLDYSGDPASDDGFKYLRKQYGIVSKLIDENTSSKWPSVELVGPKDQLEKFLLSEYGSSKEFITANLKSVFGE